PELTAELAVVVHGGLPGKGQAASRKREAPGRSPRGFAFKDSDQRAGNGSGVVVMPARCMPVTVSAAPRPPHLRFELDLHGLGQGECRAERADHHDELVDQAVGPAMEKVAAL